MVFQHSLVDGLGFRDAARYPVPVFDKLKVTNQKGAMLTGSPMYEQELPINTNRGEVNPGVQKCHGSLGGQVSKPGWFAIRLAGTYLCVDHCVL